MDAKVVTLGKNVAPERVSPEVFASHNQISVSTVYRMCRTGRLAAMKIGQQWRIDEPASIAKLAAEHA